MFRILENKSIEFFTCQYVYSRHTLYIYIPDVWQDKDSCLTLFTIHLKHQSVFHTSRDILTEIKIK